LAAQGAQIIGGAAEILTVWGWSTGTESDDKKSVAIPRSLGPGGELARLLEIEMAGGVVYRSGRVFERNLDGK
jgi:hypothetical protein